MTAQRFGSPGARRKIKSGLQRRKKLVRSIVDDGDDVRRAGSRWGRTPLERSGRSKREADRGQNGGIVNGAAVVAAALLFLGFPFYWGAFGHPSVILPLAWGVFLAVVTSLESWWHSRPHVVTTLLATSFVSLAASAGAFALGHLLSR